MPSPTPWLQLGQRTLHLEELPALLERSKLLLPLLRWLVLETSISSIVVSEEDQLLCQQQFLARNNIESDEQLRAWLQSNGLSEEDASRNLIDGVRLERFKLERFSSQVERIFLDTKESRDRVVYSLLRVHDQDAAQELHDMLSDNENMPEWVQSKITKATDYIDSVRDYLKSEKDKSVDEGTDAPKGPESYEAQYKRRLVKTTDPEHKAKGYKYRIKGKKDSSLTKKLYKTKPGQAEFNKQMRRIAGHEFG